MRRYRILNFDFDTRATVLTLPIDPLWEPNVQQSWTENKLRVRNGLELQLGSDRLAQKIDRFCELGAAPFSVVAFHNQFYAQARIAYAMGSYYPALTAACSLGERVLNHMILLFRDDFSDTPEYRRVFRKNSFDDWNVAINTLDAWGILTQDAVTTFRTLREIRNRSIHFNPRTDLDVRADALLAMRTLQQVIEQQFTVFGDRPWFIPNDCGLSFIRKAFETDPFVRKIILPGCALVGPGHDVERGANGSWLAHDPDTYPESDVTDDEYIALFKEYQARRAG